MDIFEKEHYKNMLIDKIDTMTGFAVDKSAQSFNMFLQSRNELHQYIDNIFDVINVVL